MWATRLHLYGGKEEMALLSAANQLIAGLPIPVDQMSAEEQLMLMGLPTPTKTHTHTQTQIAQGRGQSTQLIGGGGGGGGVMVMRENENDNEEDSNGEYHGPVAQLYTGGRVPFYAFNIVHISVYIFTSFFTLILSFLFTFCIS